MTDVRKTEFGNGGEPHQQPLGEDDVLTTNHGVPVSDNQNSLKSGKRGPTLLEDFVLREKIFHFDHERIPERIVHARGSGAHGVFEATDDISDLSRAAVFTKGEKTEVFVRFSTVTGGAGSVDTPRDVRGFAVKFYTREGNWDLVGNNIPVFFIQDAIKFPDLIHSVKMEADRAYPQAATAHDTFWDWASLMPETTHMLMWAMSDRVLPRSFRMMEGFGVHTFRLVNAEGRSSFVKFHWKPRLGLQSTIWDEANKLQAADNDYQRRDLWEAIDTGAFPQWDLGIQVFDQAFAEAQPYDVLDATKLIPEEDVPVRVIGTLTLNRNPDNFFAETEQVAFLPTNIVPGIDFTNDPLLQGRLFSYLDTQKSRLGTTNFHQIPINAPRCPFANFQRDGLMQTRVPKGRANYEPNSLAEHGEEGGPRASMERGFVTTNAATGADEEGDKMRVRTELFADHYSQARLFYRSQTESEQAHIASAYVFELSKVGLLDKVPARMVANLRNVDEDLARRVADGLGIDLPEATPAARPTIDMPPSDALSIHKNMKPVLEGRAVGILIADGTNAEGLAKLVAAIEAEKGKAVIVAPKIGITLSDGSKRKADGQLAGTPSQIFDAVAILVNEEGCASLLKQGPAIQFVMDAFGHLKAIGMTEATKPLLEKAGVEPDDGVVDVDHDFVEAAAKRFYKRESDVRLLA
ncbi:MULTISPECIES: catalase [Sphingomonas]|jgi:catalase|uniref:Catalase n=1 Tax=Sphingomonas aquatilis TaxID=93063 RepID=A0AAW3TW70_9SPHN|nr:MULTISPECIES: catalase [Sphingomonas]APX67834.1 catalase [Sphingomonas sp. LK11]MBB3877188.1 catalase [Sphingomonas aquatilis]RSU63284.1 catalase HPII [Sphingomonas sp. S-NIH.Pt1_0416]GEM71084.1 catalase [Sphingomonas aquatilis NBRC 16722]